MCDIAGDLAAATNALSNLAQGHDFSDPSVYHSTVAAIETVCAALARADRLGMPRPSIRQLVTKAREVHASSPFVRRLQTWPRGYPGDFETIEYLMRQENKAEPHTIGYLIEQCCLAGSIAQQHRNKVHYQACKILRTVVQGNIQRTVAGHAPAVLVIASGSSPDIRMIQEDLAPWNFRIVINDVDSEALCYSLQELSSIADRVVAVHGNVIRRGNDIRLYGPYDLVVAGGLFDYLDSRWATKLASTVLNDWLAQDGVFLFTNIARGNPYRLWMECIADWRLYERTEHEMLELTSKLTTRTVTTRVRRDQTSLALLAEVRVD